MKLKIGDKAILPKKVYKEEDRIVTIRNFKWNFVLVEFEDGEQDWIDSKYVRHTDTA